MAVLCVIALAASRYVRNSRTKLGNASGSRSSLRYGRRKRAISAWSARRQTAQQWRLSEGSPQYRQFMITTVLACVAPPHKNLGNAPGRGKAIPAAGTHEIAQGNEDHRLTGTHTVQVTPDRTRRPLGGVTRHTGDYPPQLCAAGHTLRDINHDYRSGAARIRLQLPSVQNDGRRNQGNKLRRIQFLH